MERVVIMPKPKPSNQTPHSQKPTSQTPKTPVLTPNGSFAGRYYILAVAVLLLDQLSKYYFEQRLAEYETIALIEPVLNFTLAYNRGAAFSLLANQSGWQKWFFVLLGSVVAVFLLAYLRQVPRQAYTLSVGLGLILGGAVGNVIDRLLYGHVIDFIHVHYGDAWHYPIFNVADMGICVGMVLVLIDVLFLEKKRH